MVVNMCVNVWYIMSHCYPYDMYLYSRTCMLCVTLLLEYWPARWVWTISEPHLLQRVRILMQKRQLHTFLVLKETFDCNCIYEQSMRATINVYPRKKAALGLMLCEVTHCAARVPEITGCTCGWFCIRSTVGLPFLFRKMWCTGCSHIVCTTCTVSVLQVDHCVAADPHQDWGLSRQCCTACQVVSEQRKGEADYPVSQLGMIILQTTLYNLETLMCVLYLHIDTFLNHFIYSQFAYPYYLKRLPTLWYSYTVLSPGSPAECCQISSTWLRLYSYQGTYTPTSRWL